MKRQYYVDACIWLNLFKKEGDSEKGIPYWILARNFIKKVMFSENDEILYSGFVLKELRFKLDETTFNEKFLFLENEEKFRFIKAVKEDYKIARELESEHNFHLSFFDYLHFSICKRLGAILITRDKEFYDFAKKHVVVKKPEELLS